MHVSEKYYPDSTYWAIREAQISYLIFRITWKGCWDRERPYFHCTNIIPWGFEYSYNRNYGHFIFWPHSSQASVLNINNRSSHGCLHSSLFYYYVAEEWNYILILVYIKLFLISWICFKLHTGAMAAPPAEKWKIPDFKFFNNYLQYIGIKFQQTVPKP